MRWYEVGLLGAVLACCGCVGIQRTTMTERIPKAVLLGKDRAQPVAERSAVVELVSILKAPLDAVSAAAGCVSDVTDGIVAVNSNTAIRRTRHWLLLIGKDAHKQLPVAVKADNKGPEQVASEQTLDVAGSSE